MKPALKAALISALVFPGLGHIYLKRAARGCLFLLPTLVALTCIVMRVLERTRALLEQVQAGSDLELLADQLTAAAPSVAITVCALCWGGSIIDSFLIQKS